MNINYFVKSVDNVSYICLKENMNQQESKNQTYLNYNCKNKKNRFSTLLKQQQLYNKLFMFSNELIQKISLLTLIN